MQKTILEISKNWKLSDANIQNLEEIKSWITERNNQLVVSIDKVGFANGNFWFYDPNEGCIRNKNRSFFSITGFQKVMLNGCVLTQPIILQQEIGYLGIICKEFDGVMHFLMQAKVEPGNVN